MLTKAVIVMAFSMVMTVFNAMVSMTILIMMIMPLRLMLRLLQEKPEWLEVVKRILMPTFVGDWMKMPDDPLGKDGPSLDSFLKF